LRPKFKSMRLLFSYLFVSILVFSSLNTFAGSEKDNEKLDNSIVIDRISNKDIEVVVPSIIFAFKPVEIKVKFTNPQHSKLLLNNNKLHFIINGEDVELLFTDGVATFTHKFNDDSTLSIYVEEFSYNKNITVFPIWAIVLPTVLIIIWIIRRATKKRKKKPSIILK
jgi:hypothetical protein